MSAETARPTTRSTLRAAVLRVVLGHQIRRGEPGLHGVAAASNGVTALASLLVIAGVVGAPVFLVIAQLAFHGSRSTAADLWTLSLISIAAGFTLRFVGAIVNLYAQSFTRPRSRLTNVLITVGFAVFLLVGGLLLFWCLALLAAFIAL